MNTEERNSERFQKVSKNCYVGAKLLPEAIMLLAKRGEPIIWEVPGKFKKVLPAAFVQNWTLRQISLYNFYSVIKEEEKRIIESVDIHNSIMKNMIKNTGKVF